MSGHTSSMSQFHWPAASEGYAKLIIFFSPFRRATFHMSAGLINYEPVWEAYIYEVFKSCASDSVPYLGV